MLESQFTFDLAYRLSAPTIVWPGFETSIPEHLKEKAKFGYGSVITSGACPFWSITGNGRVMDFVTKIERHVILKRKHLYLIRRFVALKGLRGRENRAKRIEIARKLHELNSWRRRPFTMHKLL